MKRGIVEMADALAINKADGNHRDLAQLAKRNYEQALHLFPPPQDKPGPKVFTCSALENRGLNEIWMFIEKFINQSKKTQYFQRNRQQQQQYWMYELINQQLTQDFFQHDTIKQMLPQIQKGVIDSKITPRDGVERLLKSYQR